GVEDAPVHRFQQRLRPEKRPVQIENDGFRRRPCLFRRAFHPFHSVSPRFMIAQRPPERKNRAPEAGRPESADGWTIADRGGKIFLPRKKRVRDAGGGGFSPRGRIMQIKTAKGFFP